MVPSFEGMGAIPEEISGYKVQEVVSRGASAFLLRVRDSDGTVWAMKFVPDATKSDREFLAREVQNLTKIDSPRVSKFKELIEDEAGSGIVMEFVPGQNLAQMKADLPLRGLLFRSFAIAVLDAVKTIHSAGLVHRDLKPENVVFGEDGVKVVDFGISMDADSAHGEESGTPTWVSPEQAQGEPATTASDIFNLGLLLAFASSGVHPFGTGASDAVLYRLINKAPNLDAVPPALREPVEAALEKDPKKRPDLETLTVWVSGSGGLSGEVKSESNDSTVLASKTILGRVALGESRPTKVAGKTTTSRPNNGGTRRPINRGLVALFVLSLFLFGGGITSYLYLGQVLPASGPVVVEVVNNSQNENRGNAYIQVTNGLVEQEVVIAEDRKRQVLRLNENLNWSINSMLSFRYVPSFSEDEKLEFSIDPRSLGLNGLSDGLEFRVKFDLKAVDTLVEVRGPTSNGFNLSRKTYLSKWLDRGNELMAIQECTDEETSYLRPLVRKHQLAPYTWGTILSDSGLNYSGSLYYSTWASRASKALDALESLQTELLDSQVPRGTALHDQQLKVEEEIRNIEEALIAFRSASWAESKSRFDRAWSDIYSAENLLRTRAGEFTNLVPSHAEANCESRFD